MKRKSILILGLLAVMAAGCSKDSPSPEPGGDDWRHNESLPVPILFGSMDMRGTTKAAINTLDSAKGLPFGVFAWADESSDKMKVSAQSIFDDSYRQAQIFGTEGEYTLNFVNAAKTVIPVFYPTTSKYNYSFYAYYDGKEDVSGEYETGDDCYYARVPFNKPFKDILWGRFRDKDLPYDDVSLPHLTYEETVIKGFNARFSRAAAKQKVVSESAYYPDIKFKHVSSACRFYAKADTSMNEAQYQRMKTYLTIDSLTISNLPFEAKLIIASRDTLREGGLEKVSGSLGTAVLHVLDTLKPGREGSGTLLTDGKEDTFFIVPGQYDSTTVVTLHMTIADEYHFTVDFPLEYVSGGVKSSNFQAGKCYTFIIIFKSIEDIRLKVKLSEWETGPETEVKIFE